MEAAPNTGFNAEPNEPNRPSGGKEGVKKFTPWSPDTPPVRRFESSRGDTALSEHEKRLPFHPIGERPVTDAPMASEHDLSSMLRREHAQPPLRAAEDLGSTATREEQQHLDDFFRNNERETSSAGERRETDKDKKDTKAEPEVPMPRPESKKPEIETEEASSQDAFQNFLAGHKELADLSEEALASTDVAKPIDTSSENHPDGPARGDFEDFITSQAELADVAAAEPALKPVAENTPTDDAFRELVTREGAPDPGSTAWHENEPGTPPTDAGGNMPPRTPVPPTAEGGEYDTPEPGPFGEQTPLSPSLARNPWVEAGDLMQPATLAGLTALEAQQELDNLRNKSRDAGLAAAVGILGLGLVLEHFGAKRRWKRQQKQLKSQGKELKQTSRTLEEERLSHEQTRQELRRLSGAHTITNEQLHQVRAHNVPEVTATAEAGLVGALAATELANRVARKTEEHQQEAATSAAARTREGIASSPIAGQELAHGPGASLKLPEAMASTIYANTVREEVRHERMRDKTADAGGAAGATVPDPRNSQPSVGAMLPPVMSAESGESVSASPAQKQAQQKQSSLLASRWTWAIIGLIIVAAAAALFG